MVEVIILWQQDYIAQKLNKKIKIEATLEIQYLNSKFIIKNSVIYYYNFEIYNNNFSDFLFLLKSGHRLNGYLVG